jgi:hypothetical protein
MLHTRSKLPKTQRVFADCWGELDYLCKKMRYWLYTKKQKPRAEHYIDRLARVLRKLPENERAIIREEGLALLHELKGDLRAAIAHREREIALMERLHQDAQSPRYAKSTKAYMLRDRDTADLRERRAILESLKKDLPQNHKPAQPKKYLSVDDPWESDAG